MGYADVQRPRSRRNLIRSTGPEPSADGGMAGRAAIPRECHRTAAARQGGRADLSAAAAAVLEAVHAARTEPPGDSWYAAEMRDRPAVAQAWEMEQRNPRSRRRSTGSRRPRSNGWGGEAGITAVNQRKRDAGAAPMKIGPRGSNPDKGGPCRSWRGASPQPGAGALIINCSARRRPPTSANTSSSAPGTGTDRGSGGRFHTRAEAAQAAATVMPMLDPAYQVVSARIGAVMIAKAVPATAPATQNGQVNQPARYS
jgi:hypothetical protein